MRIKGNYVLREIGGDHILVPVGETAMEMNGLITVDDVGVLIWKGIKSGKSEAEILKEILIEYEVSEDIARTDLVEFLDKLERAGLAEK